MANFDVKIAVSCTKRCSDGCFVRQTAIIVAAFGRNVRQLLILKPCVDRFQLAKDRRPLLKSTPLPHGDQPICG
jgi:hypothetical protein